MHIPPINAIHFSSSFASHVLTIILYLPSLLKFLISLSSLLSDESAFYFIEKTEAIRRQFPYHFPEKFPQQLSAVLEISAIVLLLTHKSMYIEPVTPFLSLISSLTVLPFLRPDFTDGP